MSEASSERSKAEPSPTSVSSREGDMVPLPIVDPVSAWLDRANEGHRRMVTDPVFRRQIERDLSLSPGSASARLDMASEVDRTALTDEDLLRQIDPEFRRQIELWIERELEVPTGDKCPISSAITRR